MDNNNQNPNTGAKGVFPGVNQINTPNSNGGINIAPLNELNNPGEAVMAAPAPAANTKTYFRMETKNAEGQISGILEIDLISFREKGEESRYVKILSVGAGEDGNQSDTNLSIDNEGDFNRFKKFVSELNWND